MSEKIIRFASLGTSSIMNVMQEAIRLTPGMECQVICSRDEKRAAEYAQKIGVPEFSGSFEETIKRDDIDAVYIATPNSLHIQQALMALSCGKHVILEKPASLDEAGIHALMAEAKKNDVYFFEAITTIFMPNFIACKQMLPDIGRILNVRINYGQYSSKLGEYMNGIVPSNLDPALGGGALNDMGIYTIHAAVNLFGEPDEVCYKPVLGTNGVDIEGELILTYKKYPAHLSTAPLLGIACEGANAVEDGLTCHLFTSKNRSSGSGIYIEGTQGYFEESGPLNDCMTCRAGIGAREFAVDRQPQGNRMLYEMAAFRDAINQHDDAFYAYMCHQSLMAAKILEAAQK